VKEAGRPDFKGREVENSGRDALVRLPLPFSTVDKSISEAHKGKKRQDNRVLKEVILIEP